MHSTAPNYGHGICASYRALRRRAGTSGSSITGGDVITRSAGFRIMGPVNHCTGRSCAGAGSGWNRASSRATIHRLPATSLRPAGTTVGSVSIGTGSSRAPLRPPPDPGWELRGHRPCHPPRSLAGIAPPAAPDQTGHSCIHQGGVELRLRRRRVAVRDAAGAPPWRQGPGMSISFLHFGEHGQFMPTRVT